MTFDVAALTAAQIREEIEDGGVRVRTTAMIAGARIAIQVHIGFGDAITPAAIEIDYLALLDAPAPHLRAYPVETVVAEKFEALVTLGMANSRLKDFYDLWVISRTFEFRRPALVQAVQRTFERRGTVLPSGIPVGLTDDSRRHGPHNGALSLGVIGWRRPLMLSPLRSPIFGGS